MLSQHNLKVKRNKVKGRRAKNNKFRKLSSLFNMYAGLHLIGNAIEYTIMINSNILIKKLKYKIFRIIIDVATFSNFIKFLFTKDVLKQFFRLNLINI